MTNKRVTDTAVTHTTVTGERVRKRRGSALGRLWRQSTGRFGLIVVGLVVLTAAVSLVWTPFDPQRVEITDRWAPPGWPHLLGTDNTGRDMLSMIMAGARTTVFVAVGAGIVATVFGVLLAALGALTARWVRETVAVLVDILIAFPVLLIAMMISAVWGGSLWIVVWAVGIGFGVNIARVMRPELRRVLRSDFVMAGKASGLTPLQNLGRHLLPNVALSYLGFGASVTEPSWGRLLADLQGFLTVYPLSVVWPGLVITITVLALNLLGDAIREATDPTLREARGSTRREGGPSARRARTHIPEVIS